MKKEIKYYVIGGQYTSYNYGGTYTLEGAKRLATKHEEYWDNWQGWHKPDIYKASDCSLGKNFFETTDFYPKEFADPVMYWDYKSKRWMNYDE